MNSQAWVQLPTANPAAAKRGEQQAGKHIANGKQTAVTSSPPTL
jgi:methenyltetrahydromethanopterin cyclohydrolase